MNGSFTPGIVFIVLLTVLVITCLLGRRLQVSLFYGLVGALVLPIWWFVGVIYSLGPWHAWRTAGIG